VPAPSAAGQGLRAAAVAMTAARFFGRPEHRQLFALSSSSVRWPTRSLDCGPGPSAGTGPPAKSPGGASIADLCRWLFSSVGARTARSVRQLIAAAHRGQALLGGRGPQRRRAAAPTGSGAGHPARERPSPGAGVGAGPGPGGCGGAERARTPPYRRRPRRTPGDGGVGPPRRRLASGDEPDAHCVARA